MNQRGSISFLVLVPTLVAILAIVSAIVSLVFTFRKDQKSCRSISLDVQATQGEALNKILKLNPTAKSLRHKEKSLKIAIAAAAVIPGAQATLDKLYMALRLVQASRRALDVQQKAIIHAANLKATQTANSSPKLPHKMVRLRIHSVQKNETAPEYDIDTGFEKAQSVNYSYKISIKNILPGWLFKFFVDVKDLNLQCGSTLKKQEDKWLPVLNAVN